VIKVGSFAFLVQPDGNVMDVIEFTDFAKEIRLDVVEYHLGKGFASKSPEYLSKLKYRARDHGLPIGYLGSGGGFAGTPPEIADKVAKAKADVDIAVFLGSPMIRLMCGRPKDDDPNPQKTWADTIKAFQDVADYAATKAVSLGLHNHAPPARPHGSDILRAWKAINRPNVTIIMDTGQWWPDYGTGQGTANFQPNIKIYDYMEEVVAHASYVRAKIYKIDSGKEEYFDYERIIRMLKSVNYNGAVSVVYEGQKYNNCSDRDAIRMGADHLRRIIDKVGL